MPPHRPNYLDALYHPLGSIQGLISIRTTTGKIVPFRFNTAQVDYGQKATSRDIILKRRRLGFSTLKLAEGLARAAFLGQRCGIISHNMRLTHEFLRVVGMMYDSIPAHSRPEVSSRNVEEMVFPKLGGSLTIGTARIDIFGRGDTFQFVHWSEVAHSPTPTDREIWLGISEAAKDGDISWESTANGMAGLFYDEVMRVYNQVSDYWQLHFYPWWWGTDTSLPGFEWPHLTPLDEKEAQLVALHGLTPGQIAWRREKRAVLGPKFAQEYPEGVPEAFIASGSNYFDLRLLLQLLDECPKPAEMQDDGLWVWEKPLSRDFYIIGADVGGGGLSYVDNEGEEQSDYSAAVVLDIKTGHTVASFRGKIKPEPFAELLMTWGKQYNHAFLAAERNGYGAIVNNVLMEREYPNIYMEQTSKNEWAYGPYTSASSRYALLADFDEALRTRAILVRDERALREAMTFTSRTDTMGRVRYQASPGQPDDLLFAHFHAWHWRDQAPIGESAKPIIRAGRWLARS